MMLTSQSGFWKPGLGYKGLRPSKQNYIGQ